MNASSDKVALIAGVANDHSIAAGCAQAFASACAKIALTYATEKARPYVQRIAEAIGATLLMPLDVEAEGQMEAVFAAV